ncbi:MAG: hypothetical protein QUV35_03170 [Hydrogenophaga sp.]|uniref:hypothetical protein n=1 Tax=Hydrogenophaga sp. TaxID=1904254 RepID=UPI0026207C4D|nr:hypothetical protein [Hydrogenophaga sp.]MDM7941608.1 hypothetical protein [Hydrogenophaga sp.]
MFAVLPACVTIHAMQTELEQLTEADRATTLLVQGDAEQKRKAAEVLRALANLGHTEAVRAAAAGALLQLLPNNAGH